ncbi:MAG: sulfate adenylyltransferase subunit 1 [Burkholderiales bacterium]
MDGNETFLAREVDLLRLVTAGSVDDGKSTLIGRLLFDSKGIFEDQLSAIERASLRRGKGDMDLSLLTDGLQAEREQGITIDVAYRYFSTPRRKFIIADSPGHEQYTRNMVTAASTANLAVILLDARNGILTQTRRHTYIAGLLGIPHIVFAVNKMDLVDYREPVFLALREQLKQFAAQAGIPHAYYVPISALQGDNVVEQTVKMRWYDGPTLLDLLEEVEVERDVTALPFRFPVQGVVRPHPANVDQRWHDFRGYSGRIETGTIAVGNPVTILPSGRTTTIRGIHTYDGGLEVAIAPQSVTLLLQDQIDVSRGDMIVGADAVPAVTRSLSATLCWLSETPLDPRRRYYLKHTTRTVKALIEGIGHRVNIHTLQRELGIDTLRVNEIGRVQLKVQQPLVIDAYRNNRSTGSFILIDETTNNSVAAGLVEHG